jgi:hypothetical protein
MILPDNKIKLGKYIFIDADASIITDAQAEEIHKAREYCFTKVDQKHAELVSNGPMRAKYMVEQAPHPDLILLPFGASVRCFMDDVLLITHNLREMGKPRQMRHFVTPSRDVEEYKRECAESLALFRDYCFDANILDTLIVTAPVETVNGRARFVHIWCNPIPDTKIWDKMEKVTTPYGDIMLLYQTRDKYVLGRNYNWWTTLGETEGDDLC